jgi:hypothetical protein
LAQFVALIVAAVIVIVSGRATRFCRPAFAARFCCLVVPDGTVVVVILIGPSSIGGSFFCKGHEDYDYNHNYDDGARHPLLLRWYCDDGTNPWDRRHEARV